MNLHDAVPAWAPPAKALAEMDLDERELASRRAKYGSWCARVRVRAMRELAKADPPQPITGRFPYFTQENCQ